MKIKTSELIGAQLDWAVAGAAYDKAYWGRLFQQCVITGKTHGGTPFKYSPSECWSQGAEIIQAIGPSISLELRLSEVSASFLQSGIRVGFTARTILIAAMRAIVAAKLGEEIEVPEELV